ncbi:hypothetical protein [Tautonia marina]|uniref:hypothetical protein n=1 Tax=Tautonia marina TaxID=2653855 RepID=UPI00126101E8|nr:hypothetical protein [Tautonia marina]
MNRKISSRFLGALLPLVLAGPVQAGLVTHFTFADRTLGDSTFAPNVGLVPDSHGNLVSGQNVTVEGTSLTIAAAGGRNLAGKLLNPQRFHLDDPGLGVRGGGSGWLHTGESLIFHSDELVTLTELVFFRRRGTEDLDYSFDLLVDENNPVTSLVSTSSTLARFVSLERFTMNVTGNTFEIRTRGGEARLAQLSIKADSPSLAAVVAVPEPSTLAMAACGTMIGLVCFGRSRNRSGRFRV